METGGVQRFYGFHTSYCRVAGNEGMEKNMETIIQGLGFRRNGNANRNYNGLYKDYYKDPFLHSQLAP